MQLDKQMKLTVWFQIHPNVIGRVQFEVLEAYPTIGDEIVGWNGTIVEYRETKDFTVVNCGLNRGIVFEGNFGELGVFLRDLLGLF